MTAEQQKLCEDNHGLIYGFIARFGLPIDEYYGIAAMGFCRAAMSYNGKYKFSTYADRCMRNELFNAFKRDNRQSRKPQQALIYMNSCVSQNMSCSFENVISSQADVEETILSNEAVKTIIQHFDQREKIMVSMLLKGHTEREIAEKLEMTPQNVNLIKKKLRLKLKRLGVIA